MLTQKVFIQQIFTQKNFHTKIFSHKLIAIVTRTIIIVIIVSLLELD
jgi:hypothetical protein